MAITVSMATAPRTDYGHLATREPLGVDQRVAANAAEITDDGHHCLVVASAACAASTLSLHTGNILGRYSNLLPDGGALVRRWRL